MDTELLARIQQDFKNKTEFDDVFTLWHKYRSILPGATLLYSFDDIGTQLPLEPFAKHFDGQKFHIRNIYSRSNNYYFSEKIFLDISREGTTKIPIIPVAMFDTQLGGYALAYFNDLKKSDPKKYKFIGTEIGDSFIELVRTLYKANIGINFTFYIYENYGNYLAGEQKIIKDHLFALHKIANANREAMIENGEYRPNYSPDFIRSRVEESFNLFEDETFVRELMARETLQSHIACVILKAILIRHSSLGKADKIRELSKFVCETLRGVLQREMIACCRWLYGFDLEFFNPINLGAGDRYVPETVNGMAWDFVLIRNVEQISAMPDEDEPRNFPYYISFDRRLVELADLVKHNGCIVPDRKQFDQYIMLSEEHLNDWFISVVGDDFYIEHFNSDKSQQRRASQLTSEQVSSLRRRLEFKVVNLLANRKK